jgi:putative hydrolase of the HAD superfamily
MTAQALVFDFGNVLVDIDFGRAFAAWAVAAGVPAAAIATRFSLDEPYCAHERGEIDERTYFAHLRRSLGISLTDEEFLSGWDAILGEPIPGIEPLVSELAVHWPLYVFSNTNPSHAAGIASRHRSLMRHFRHLFTSCELGARKPEPEAFARLAQRIGMAPGRLVFFDDLEENVIGARNAGLQAYRVESAAEIRAISVNLLAASTPR